MPRRHTQVFKKKCFFKGISSEKVCLGTEVIIARSIITMLGSSCTVRCALVLRWGDSARLLTGLLHRSPGAGGGGEIPGARFLGPRGLPGLVP